MQASSQLLKKLKGMRDHKFKTSQDLKKKNWGNKTLYLKRDLVFKDLVLNPNYIEVATVHTALL